MLTSLPCRGYAGSTAVRVPVDPAAEALLVSTLRHFHRAAAMECALPCWVTSTMCSEASAKYYTAHLDAETAWKMGQTNRYVGE